MYYNDEMYIEDLKISKSVFKKKFKSCFFYKDDLIQVSLIALFLNRLKYDEARGSYFHFAFLNSFFAMSSFLREEKRCKNCFNLVSIYTKNNDDKSLIDMLSSKFDFDCYDNYYCLLEICKNVVKNIKSNLFKEILKLYFLGYEPVNIGRVLNISRQCVSSYLKKFKYLVQSEIMKDC